VPVYLLHPNRAARETDAAHGVLTEGYSPLKHADRIAQNAAVKQIASDHGVTPNQVALRWSIQSGVVPIPRSRSVDHQRENFDVFGFELSDAELAKLDALG
jgi:diketogulonate reductase-like aldo/keto reductase